MSPDGKRRLLDGTIDISDETTGSFTIAVTGLPGETALFWEAVGSKGGVLPDMLVKWTVGVVGALITAFTLWATFVGLGWLPNLSLQH